MRSSTLHTELVKPVADTFGRPLRSLRISVTDRCNLRCQYCMPEEEYVWLEQKDILSFEEITELAGIFASVGVDQLRLTGGEPLLRRDLDRLIHMLATCFDRASSSSPRPGNGRPVTNGQRNGESRGAVRDLALTTNGILLAGAARGLRAAGLDRITVSLDTLRPDRFRALTRRDVHAQVLDGIAAVRAAGFSSLKINTVVVRGFNDDELVNLIHFGREAEAEVRFIEYMDVGGATHWSMDQVLPQSAILATLEQEFGRIEPVAKTGQEEKSAPADRFVLPDGTTFGIIASTTRPFCGSCDRARLTPDGMFLLCLYARSGVDLKRALRDGAPHDQIAAAVTSAWQQRTDRGAEQRKGLGARGVLFQIEDLRKDPHLEMHTRGG